MPTWAGSAPERVSALPGVIGPGAVDGWLLMRRREVVALELRSPDPARFGSLSWPAAWLPPTTEVKAAGRPTGACELGMGRGLRANLNGRANERREFTSYR
jgi:hypothetical protein